MINKDRLMLFVEALESEKYNQCIGQLHADNSFDAAGLMCEIYRLNREEKNFPVRWENRPEGKDGYLFLLGNYPDDAAVKNKMEQWDWRVFSVPPIVFDWYGLDFEKSYFVGTLYYYNDKKEKSFRQIAEFVRTAIALEETDNDSQL